MPPQTLSSTETQTFVARQPIVDRHQRVSGYELLFRSQDGPLTSRPDAGQATARVIVDGMFSIGLDTLVGDRLAFVNVGRDLLLERLPAVLPPHRVVLELSSDVVDDEATLDACRELKAAGFVLALDDFTLASGHDALLPFASYVKVDFSIDNGTALTDLVRSVRSASSALVVAKRIERPDEFSAALDAGFDYFQGFFFGHPVVSEGRSLASADLGRLRLLQALQDARLTISELEDLIKPDAALCYQIFRTVNSAALAQSRDVQSIRQALVLLGRDTVRRWVSVWTLAGLGERAHPELISMSAVRGRCCEVLAELAGGEALAAEGYLVGLCSMLDTLLRRPMADVLQHVPLSDESRAALLGEDNRLSHLLKCVVTYERGDWPACVFHATHAGIEPADVSGAYLDAMVWMRELQRV